MSVVTACLKTPRLNFYNNIRTVLGPHPHGGQYLDFKRFLSGTEVSTALRPFYFLVHPDLFGKFPQEQSENEKSLKILKNYVDSLLHDKKKPNPVEVKFFVKPRGSSLNSQAIKDRNLLPFIRIRLRDIKLRTTVVNILKAAELPTGYVDAIPEKVDNAQKLPDDLFKEEAEEDFAFGFREKSKTGFSSTDKNQPLLGWLQANVDIARQRLSRHEPIRLETERLQGAISYEYGIEDMLWDCGWETVHRKGVVEAFLAVVVQYPEVRPIIQNKTIVFGKDSGVGIRGEISLYSGEVRNNWLNVIKTAPDYDKQLESLPMWERTLSQALRGVQIVSDPSQIVKVDNHRTRLRQLVTSVGDYMSRRSLPSSWPDDLSKYKIIVENDASALMIRDDGVFIIPASTPGFLLVEFISKGMAEADRKMEVWADLEKEETFLIGSCINELGLIQLDKDDNISAHHMVHCCSRLLKCAPTLRHLTHGNHLVIARYYMVKSDGVICVPWDLVMDGISQKDGDNGNQPILHLTMY